MRWWCTCATLLAALAAAAPLRAQPDEGDALVRALVSALRPALPFPEAGPDGIPATGGADPVWVVRWPEAGDGHVEVLANPLNAENRKRALAAEEEIQKAAMRSQRRSQGDYERALSDFERTGRVSGIREISLDDDGLAGERYDAESHLLVSVAPLDGDLSFSVATGVLPELVAGIAGPAAVIHVPANVFEMRAEPGEPAEEHYCSEQAWLVFGASGSATIAPRDHSPHVDVTVPVAAPPAGRRGVVVSLSGNPLLVDQALRRADWPALRAALGN
ncbi:MAG: hypothetical protein AB7Q16_25560 [Vicinamibacterales bacterium]